MGVAFDAPLALLLLVPAAGADGRAPPRRAAADGLATTVASRCSSERRCSSPSCSRWPASGSSCRSIGWPRSSSSTCPTRSATPAARMPSRSCARRSSRAPRRRRGRHRRLRQGGAGRAPAGGAGRDRPDRLRAGHARRPTSAPRSGWRRRCSPTTPRNGSSCCPTATTRPAAARPRPPSPRRAGVRVETRQIGLGRRRGGPHRAADDAIDRPTRRVDPGRGPDPIDGRPDGDRPAVRRRRAGSHPARRADRRRDPRHLRRDADARPASTPSGSSSRRPSTRSPERPGRLEHDRQGRAADARRWPATRRSRRTSSSPRSSNQRQQVETLLPEALPTDLAGLAAYDSIVLVDVPRLRLSDRQLSALQVYVRDLGRGLVMIGGPKSYGAGGYAKTPLEESLPVDMGVRDRQKQPDIALVVVIDQSGSMAACHCNTFNGGMGGGVGHRRRPQGRHRQGGDPACGRGADRARRARRGRASTSTAHWVVRTQPLGEIGDLQGQIAGIRADGQTNIFAGLDQAVSSLEAATATRRHIILLTDGWSSSGQYDAILGQDEGGRDHALDGRGRRRLEPVPREPRPAGRRPLLRRGEPVEHPGHLPQGDPAGLRPADRRGGVLPDPDLELADPARPRRRSARSCSATTARRPRRPRRACSSPPATTRSSPSGSTASAGRSPGRPTRPGAGPRTGSAGAASTGSSASSSAGRSRARRPAASRRRSRRPAATTSLHVESVEPDGSPRDFYATSAVVVGPDLEPRTVGLSQVAPGRLRGAARRDRPGCLRRPHHPDAGPARRRSGGRSGWSRRPPPSTASSARTSRSSPRCAPPRRDRSIATALDPWIHDLTTTERFTDLWPALLVLALLLWPLDIALRRMSLGRRELAAARAGITGLGRRGRVAGPRTATAAGLLAASERARSGDGRAALRPVGPAAAAEPAAPATTTLTATRPSTPTTPASAAAPPSPADAAPPEAAGSDTMARLRDAKRRARDR